MKTWKRLETSVCGRHALKKADPKIVSLRVYGIFAEKQAFFDKYEPMQSYKINCQSLHAVYS